jgi:hypothetical protein
MVVVMAEPGVLATLLQQAEVPELVGIQAMVEMVEAQAQQAAMAQVVAEVVAVPEEMLMLPVRAVV